MVIHTWIYNIERLQIAYHLSPIANQTKNSAAAVGPGAARRGAWGARTALGHRRRRRRGAWGPPPWGLGGGKCYQRSIWQINRENENERKLEKPRFDLRFTMHLHFLPKIKDDPRVDTHILVQGFGRNQ